MSCNTLTKTTVKDILLKIVKAWKYSKCNTPNSFATVSGNPSTYLNHTTFNKSTQDYKNGEFWARNWEQAGSDANTMCREFPAVLFEHVVKKRPDLCSDIECRTYAIDVISKYDCEECKGCNRTSDVVSCDTDDMLDFLFDTFLEFTLYCDDEGGKVWLHPIEGEPLGYESEEVTIRDYITAEPIESFEISLKGSNLIGWSLRFELCDCKEKKESEWNWGSNEVKKVGKVECDAC